MTLEEYRRRRAERERAAPSPRTRCGTCRRPHTFCYCAVLRPFEATSRFVILIHHAEARRGIATGRMAHLALRGSVLVEGTDFSANDQVNALLEDPDHCPALLYPGPQAIDLADASPQDLERVFPAGKRPLIFVLDGTWSTARKMRRNLHDLPQVCFTPVRPSRFRVRRQPAPQCLSTLEAIHHTIELLGPPADRRHDGLLHVFDRMVEAQLHFQSQVRNHRKPSRPANQVPRRWRPRRVRPVVR